MMQENSRRPMRRRSAKPDFITWLKKRSLLGIGAAFFASYLFASVVYSSVQILELKKEEAHLREEISAQEKIARELESEIKYLKTNAAVEKIAREELGLVKPDEIMILPKA